MDRHVRTPKPRLTTVVRKAEQTLFKVQSTRQDQRRRLRDDRQVALERAITSIDAVMAPMRRWTCAFYVHPHPLQDRAIALSEALQRERRKLRKMLKQTKKGAA